MAELLGSSGAFEMSVFQAALVGKGTKPLRLALSPRLIPLQAGAPEAPEALMVRLKSAVAVCAVGCAESVTVNVTALVPAVVGVPVIAPDELMLSPLGKPDAVNV
jgi:hypothetical protein